jgi:sugar phosphate isomerase/epimerase
MWQSSRRTFLKTASASAAGAWLCGLAPQLMANPLGLPLGLQLYSVRDLLPKDYQGTLRELSQIGYQEVEAAGYFGRSAREVRNAMDEAHLNCVSAHYPMKDLVPHVDAVIQFGKDLGLKYIICSSPMLQNPANATTITRANMDSMTLDDWRWNAEQFNQIGEKVNAAGIRFGYHNHTAEFQAQNGVLPYDELLRLTDPAKVTFEMDCGWVIVGGKDPVDYLTKYPTRISMLHVKDFKLGGVKSTSETAPPPSAELGQGSIDYKRIFEAAKGGKIEHAFIEQEQYDMPVLDALRIDAQYWRKLTV